DYVLVSSEASRAKQTAQYLAKPLIDARFNPGSRATHVERALKSLLDKHDRPIVLVAHQPFLGQVASLLVRSDSMSQPVKKSGVYWLKSRGDSWYYKAILPPNLMKS
ncbi:MAG: hypothetical protein CR977_04220, partial [Gammaproteobacteria bacterium]